jgi:hypothetical protein
MNELSGYPGPPVFMPLVHDRPIISKPRTYSQLDLAVMEQTIQDLLEAELFYCTADPHEKYASCPTMPAKKNELREWVGR